MDEWIFAGVKTPSLLSGFSIDGVEITVPASDKNYAVRKSRRSVHDIARLEFPTQVASRRIQCVEVAIATAKIHNAFCHHWARQVNVEWIGNRLILRLHAMQTFCFKAPLTPRGKLPFQGASLCI